MHHRRDNYNPEITCDCHKIGLAEFLKNNSNYSPLLSSSVLTGAVCSRIDNGPVGSNGGDASVDSATDETQLGLAVGRIHIEGMARGLAHNHHAASVCGEHYPLHVVSVFSRNLDDGFILK